MTRLLILALGLSLATTAAACNKSKKADTMTATSDGKPRPSGTRATPQPGTATVTPVGPGADSAPQFGAIYFEFDSTTLSADARTVLERLGTWMLKNPTRLVIEGHADDRGTTEYNIALGQRRAQIIAEYLQRLGVKEQSLQTISYGEERPAVDGEDESAWAQNRRGELHPSN